MPAAIGGSVSGSSMRLSAISARSAASGASLQGVKPSRAVTRRAIDLGPSGDGAPDQIGIEPDDRVAPAHRAAFDRFQQKAHRPPVGDLEEGRHRRFEVGDQRGPDHLGLAPRVALGERRCLRLDLHGLIQLDVAGTAPPLITWFSAL